MNWCDMNFKTCYYGKTFATKITNKRYNMLGSDKYLATDRTHICFFTSMYSFIVHFCLINSDICLATYRAHKCFFSIMQMYNYVCPLEKMVWKFCHICYIQSFHHQHVSWQYGCPKEKVVWKFCLICYIQVFYYQNESRQYVYPVEKMVWKFCHNGYIQVFYYQNESWQYGCIGMNWPCMHLQVTIFSKGFVTHIALESFVFVMNWTRVIL